MVIGTRTSDHSSFAGQDNSPKTILAKGDDTIREPGRIVSDEKFMRAAVDLAHEAERHGEVPVGAVIVLDDRIIARGRNSPISTNDPTAHAEILAIREAGAAVANYRLENATIYVT